MKKVILKVDLRDDRIKKKAMKTVSGMSGVESVSVDMKDKKLTLIGEIDAVNVVGKLRKVCYTEIISVGPAKEEKKEEAPKKPEDDKKAVEIVPYNDVYGYHYNYYPSIPYQYYYNYAVIS